MAESFSETEVSMAEASSDPEPGPSTSVAIANVDVPSLLSRLRCPTSSELARKRKGKSISPPSTRIKEFPNENLSVVSKKLFGEEPVSVKKSVLKQHLRSAKHGTGKKLIVSKKNKDKKNT